MLRIANLLTLMNFISGATGIYFICMGNARLFLACFVMCLVFDSLDGWYARLKGQESLPGFYLDAIADVLSFGLMISIFIVTAIFDYSPIGFLVAIGFLASNIKRHTSLVLPGSSKVIGITNVVASFFIISLYQVNVFESTWAWATVIIALSVLMLVPVEFFNHKTFKNQIMPQKSVYGILYSVPFLLIVPGLDALWWTVLSVCVAYVTLGFLAHLEKKTQLSLILSLRIWPLGRVESIKRTSAIGPTTPYRESWLNRCILSEACSSPAGDSDGQLH